MFKKICKIITQKKEKKERKKNALNYMINYCEGNLSHRDFYQLFLSNESIQELIINDKKASKNVKIFNKRVMFSLNLSKIYDRMELFRLTANYFRRRKVELKYYNPDDETYCFVQKICPNYCYFVDNDDFLKRFLNNYMNNELNVSKGKKIVKELFKYEKYPPRWLQGSEWPIINGVPCTFLYQDGSPNNIHKDVLHFYFRNEETKEIIVVEQYI